MFLTISLISGIRTDDQAIHGTCQQIQGYTDVVLQTNSPSNLRKLYRLSWQSLSFLATFLVKRWLLYLYSIPYQKFHNFNAVTFNRNPLLKILYKKICMAAYTKNALGNMST